ncbi:MAG: amidohydrolase family protein [Alphaproteobacteria bacterium]|nr:amidohydrolase family protein [Alphaproteobacteria bacterium]
MALSLILRGGTVYDGTGKPAVGADVGIENGRIAAIGRIDAKAEMEIDAKGLAVAPGFIDIHSHSDYTLLLDPRAVSAVHQGVTLEVIGNCGFGCGPIRRPDLAPQAIYGFDGSVPLEWKSLGGYLDRLSSAKPAVNVISLVPNGQLRLSTVGLSDQPASAGQVAQMQDLLRESLSDGAIGYSTGLEYATEVGAGETELTALARVAGKAGGLYATHTRDRAAKSLEAIEEGIRTGRNAGVRTQISHLVPRATAGGIFERSIELVERARGGGQDIRFDMHTRLYGTTMLHTMLPPWAGSGGKEAARANLRSKEARQKMRQYQSILSSVGDWNRVVLLDLPIFSEYSRRSLADIAKERGLDAYDAAYDIIEATLDLPRSPMVILLTYTEDQQQAVFRHPLCMPASDATTLAPDGPLAGAVFHGAYTWASWFWRFMVRQTKALSPEDAVHRMTGLPAAVLDIADRGVLKQGARADIAVFHPDTFGETATTFEPNLLATGMRHVIVNGVLTLNEGRLTGRRGGEVLRRKGAPITF